MTGRVLHARNPKTKTRPDNLRNRYKLVFRMGFPDISVEPKTSYKND